MNTELALAPTLDARLLLSAAAAYFLVALLSGVWKYRAMMTSSTHQAPVYVDIAHRASLQYSFACVLLLVLARCCVWSEPLRVFGVVLLLIFFSTAIGTYLWLGWSRHTDNQFSERTLTTTLGMWLLIAGELAGFSILASGAMLGIWR